MAKNRDSDKQSPRAAVALDRFTRLHGRIRCAMACELIVRLGVAGLTTDGVRPLFCHVLAAIHAGDDTVAAVAERLGLEPNTVWKRVQDLGTRCGRGGLIVFPDGKRADQPRAEQPRSPRSMPNTRIALSGEAEQIAVTFSTTLMNNLADAVLKLDQEGFFKAGADDSPHRSHVSDITRRSRPTAR